MAYCMYILNTRNNHIIRYSKDNKIQLSLEHRHTQDMFLLFLINELLE